VSKRTTVSCLVGPTSGSRSTPPLRRPAHVVGPLDSPPGIARRKPDNVKTLQATSFVRSGDAFLMSTVRGQEAVRDSQVQSTFRLASRLRIGGGLVDGGLWTVRHFPVVHVTFRQLRGRARRSIRAPPESQGSGGAVPRPIKGGFPRPKLETAYVSRLRRSCCRRRTSCPRAPRYRRRSAAAVV
jgi:hypothetical protein